MLGRKMWYVVSLVAFVLLPLAGCGGKGSSLVGQEGYKVNVSGNVANAGKSTLKTLFAAAPDLGTLTVINAQDGTTLGTGVITSSGSFSNIAITLPTVKTVLVFKADVSVAGSPFRAIVPMDLSNPPAAGISASNSVTITISQDTSNVAATVSAMLGVTGVLGDAGATLNAVNKTFADAAAQVLSNGGQVLAYNTSGLALTGQVASASLLPVRDASTLTNDDLNNIALDGKILSAFIPGKKPIVNFQVVNKATGKGITGLRTFGLHIAQLQPEANGSSSYWLNYILNSSGNPASDAAFSATNNVPGNYYTVIDHGDGTYTATFAKDVTSVAGVTYDPTLIHRIGISVRSIAVPGVTATGPINPLTNTVNTNFAVPNVTAPVYDFIPSTGLVYTNPNGGNYARDLVTMPACNQCHYKLGFMSGHFASRPDTKLCVMCHTRQNTSGEGEFVTFIHRIHMGEELPAPVQPENVLNPTKVGARTTTLVTYGEQTYPQDIRNCTMCHQGKDVDNWKTKPSQKNCGSCHNDVSFATHEGGQTTDQFCAGCHTGASGIKEVSANHLPVTAPDPNNVFNVYYNTYGGVFSSYSTAQAATGVAPGNSNTNASYVVGASLSRLPVGAKVISYSVKSTSRNSSKQPVAVFKFQSQTVQTDGTLSAKTDVVFNTSNGSNEMITGFVGSPSVYFAYAVPQDLSTAPADYNGSASGYLKRIWDGTAATVQSSQKGTLTGPDASGYYTVTLTGTTVPDNAVMLTGGIGYTYGLGSVKTKVGSAYVPFATTTQPLTQVDLAAYPYDATTKQGGLSVPADNKWQVATGYTGRRLIVDNTKCNACHGRLGVKPTFHAGQRNDSQTCTFCHNVNRVNSGWGVNIKDAVHAIHGTDKRVNKFSWEATAGDKYWEITYPGYLRNCEQCHIAGMYDFSNSAYTANNGSIFDNLLFTTAATGKAINGTTITAAMVILTGTETVPASGTAVISPFIDGTTDYGKGFSATAATQDTTYANNLVISPISAACFSCHDTKSAKAHMVANGGSIYEVRSKALTQTETCIVCHGTAANNLNSTVPTIKAVHRWW